MYPILLAHGYLGFARVPLTGFDYFYKVPEHLRGLGYDVVVAEVHALRSVAARAKKLKRYLDDVSSEKVHIIAHSMGGLDSRYMISHLGAGDRVCSLTTIGTPHRGTPLADISIGILHPPFLKLIGGAVRALGVSLKGLANFMEETFGVTYKGLHNLTVDYMRKRFNKRIPNKNQVKYISYAGVTSVRRIKIDFDLSDEFLAATSLIISMLEGKNDGLVSVRSAAWGDESVRIINADHFDQVGQIAGQTGDFDHLKFYADLASQLESME